MDPFSGLDHDYLASQSFYLTIKLFHYFLFLYIIVNLPHTYFTYDALKFAWTLEHTIVKINIIPMEVFCLIALNLKGLTL